MSPTVVCCDVSRCEDAEQVYRSGYRNCKNVLHSLAEEKPGKHRFQAGDACRDQAFPLTDCHAHRQLAEVSNHLQVVSYSRLVVRGRVTSKNSSCCITDGVHARQTKLKTLGDVAFRERWVAAR